MTSDRSTAEGGCATDLPNASESSGDRPARPRRRWRWVLLAVVLIVLIPALVLLVMVTDEPDYWHIVDADDPQVRTTAEGVERAVSALITRVRPPGEVWQLPLTDHQINTWLAARMPNWLANQNVDPDIIAMLRRALLHTDGQTIQLAVQPELGTIDPVVQLRLEPRVEADGPVVLHLVGAKVGGLDLPLDTVLEKFAGNRGVPRTLPLKVALRDGREVVITRLSIGQDSLTLTCTTRRLK